MSIKQKCNAVSPPLFVLFFFFFFAAAVRAEKDVSIRLDERAAIFDAIWELVGGTRISSPGGGGGGGGPVVLLLSLFCLYSQTLS